VRRAAALVFPGKGETASGKIEIAGDVEERRKECERRDLACCRIGRTSTGPGVSTCLMSAHAIAQLVVPRSMPTLKVALSAILGFALATT
jgi:hypothetical protein